MIRTKFISRYGEEDFSSAINEFIQGIEDDEFELIDIKFSYAKEDSTNETFLGALLIFKCSERSAVENEL